MINVKVSRSEDGSITGFTVKGHAGYAEEGSDIICAAVSALCYTAAGYFRSGTPDGIFKTEFEEDDGYMKLVITDAGNERNAIRAQAVMDAWLTGIVQIKVSYGKKYIKIIEE